ncbi:MAG TPA: hypothetical protein PKH29_10190 [Oscillospiraceae bacterium]|nr:hypothetical protein [Oscillospiraceae bacterium]
MGTIHAKSMRWGMGTIKYCGNQTLRQSNAAASNASAFKCFGIPVSAAALMGFFLISRPRRADYRSVFS